MARITALAKAMQATGSAGQIDLVRAQVFLGLLLGTLPYIPPAPGAPPDDPRPTTHLLTTRLLTIRLLTIRLLTIRLLTTRLLTIHFQTTHLLTIRRTAELKRARRRTICRTRRIPRMIRPPDQAGRGRLCRRTCRPGPGRWQACSPRPGRAGAGR